ncbi:integrase [Pseudomonas cichorii]|uniref:tyrosine-type recombinase/integrase n=1 Tax=Pseudomonas cichorii TaxID=36746 RepID=UPI00191038A4|nr:site-specific integrase [Pseudomonas cichorii]GFM86129.1 integrase [Pseudomonas cichorii]
MASYRKRSGGWRAEVAKQGVRDSQTFDTKAAAVAWATAREVEIMAQCGKSRLTVSMTLSEALRRYKLDVSPTKAGQRWEELRLDRFDRELEWVGDLMERITSEQVAQWRDARLKVVKTATVRREMTLLSSVFEIARLEWKVCLANPVRDAKRPSNGPPRERRVAPGEISALINRLGHVEGQAPVTLMQELSYAFLIAIESAMRQGEILGMTAKWVNLRERFVRLPKTKNGSSRNVPLSKRACELLEPLYKGKGPNDRLFRLESASADTMFRRVRDELGIDGLTFHDTRHEAITRLARKIDVLDLARMTGHKDLKSLMIYYNATASEVAERLG